jgi:hypothetical protein
MLLIFNFVLHPSHKTEYFKQADWSEEWQKTAVDIVREEFEHVYADIVESEDSDDGQPVCPFIFFSLFFFHTFFQGAISDNIFDSLPTLSVSKKTVPADELTRYLAAPTEVASDPLAWWMERQAVYPHLSRMARDYFCIPGMQLIYYTILIKAKLIIFFS